MLQEREGEAPSWYNAIEAGVVVDLVSSLLKQGLVQSQGARVTPADVGVIATFRRQVGILWRQWHASGLTQMLCCMALLHPGSRSSGAELRQPFCIIGMCMARPPAMWLTPLDISSTAILTITSTDRHGPMLSLSVWHTTDQRGMMGRW